MFVPLAKLIVATEFVVTVLALLASSCDPFAGFDPPPTEKDSGTSSAMTLLIGLGIVVNAIAGFSILDGKQLARSDAMLRRVLITSLLTTHVVLVAFLVKAGIPVAPLIAAAVLVILAIAFSGFWSSTPSAEDVPSTTRRGIATGTAAVVAVASVVVMATALKSTYPGMDVSVDIQAMDNGRVVAMVRHFDDTQRQAIIADQTKVVWSKDAAEHMSIPAGVSLPVSPSGKLMAYENIDGTGAHVYVVVNSDGVEVSRISSIGFASSALFASDRTLLHSVAGLDSGTVVTDLVSNENRTIKSWTAVSALDDQSALMTNDNEYSLIDLNTGNVISKEPSGRVYDATQTADSALRFKLNENDACDSGWDLRRGTLQTGLPGSEKQVPINIAGQSVSSFIANPTSSIALVGTTSSSGECETYGRHYAVDITTGNVLSEVLTSYREGRSVALSPDGKSVAYIEKNKLYVKPTTGGEATRANTKSSHVDWAPAWSSDGALWFASDMKPAHENGDAWLWRRSSTGELTAVVRVD